MELKLSDINTTTEILERVKIELEPNDKQIKKSIADAIDLIDKKINWFKQEQLILDDYFGPNEEIKFMKDYLVQHLNKNRVDMVSREI